MKPPVVLKVRPSRELLVALSGLHPESPFCTPEYVQSRAQLGETPVLLGRMNGEGLQSGSVGYVSRTGLVRTLEVPSLDALADQAGWVALLKHARRRLVAIVDLNTHASRAGKIPSFPWPTTRRNRVEHIMDLQQPVHLSSQHGRAVKKAAAAGARMVRVSVADAAVLHQRLVNASMSRRMARGEAVGHVEAALEARALLAAGAGELVQVTVAGEALSSILILRSARSAYYHSAGTNPAGMEVGASPFLISACAQMLAAEGRSTFNLGDATEENPGLLRFKRGFGGYAVPLDAATVELWPFARMMNRVPALIAAS